MGRSTRLVAARPQPIVNPERERLALEHLESALAWPPGEREQRLVAALQHDVELLTDVRELLLAAEAVNESLPTALPIASSVEDAPPPERIGPYRLHELIGRGGMGSVYRAERADGAFERSVALKLMRRTRLPGPVAAQFARERQILARLQHRNIAQLFDGGVTEDGTSYFVMELLSGRAVTRYASEESLSLHSRLRLFLQICSAVQYAHSHLVVHADIKPNNIVVTSDGVAKLLDFGVAQVLADAATPPLGLTFDYASPALQRGEVPSTIDDVFSLGVLLEELLQEVAAIPPDLRAIAARARAQNPDERYPTVEALQGDVHRWLNTLPVRAHGTHWRYIARKFLARHRVVAMGIAIGGLMIAGAATALTVMYVHAEKARAQAVERFNDLRSLSHLVLFDIYDRLEGAPGALTLRRDLADAGQRYLDRLAQDPGAPVDVRLEVIEGLRRLAQVQANPGGASLAQVRQAQDNLDRAERLAATLPADATASDARSLILARIALARSRLSSGKDLDFETSHGALNRAFALVTDVLRKSPTDETALDLHTDIAVERAATLQWQGRYEEAMRVAKEALSGPEPVSQAAQLRRARLLDIFAETTYYSGDPPAAEQPYRQQLELVRKLAAANPQDLRMLRRTERAGWALGTTLLELQRFKEAEPLLRESVEIVQRLQLIEPEDRDLVRTASVVANSHAQALIGLRRFDEALPVFERSAQARRRLWESDPLQWSAARDYAVSVAALADARADAGQISRACTEYAESLAMFDRIRAAGKLAPLDEDHAIRLIRERTAAYACARH
jgi:eukaryotic-like serine/threonine-protein kinase